MNILQSINNDIRKREQNLRETQEMFPDADVPANLLEEQTLLELFGLGGSKRNRPGGNKKPSAEEQAEQARQERAADRARIEKNKNSKNVVNGDLDAKYGKAKLKADGSLPDQPDGMSRSDYEKWIESLKQTARDKSFDMGPKKNDQIRVGGDTFSVISSRDGDKMVAKAKNADGKEISVPWERLSKPKLVGRQTVYTVGK